MLLADDNFKRAVSAYGQRVAIEEPCFYLRKVFSVTASTGSHTDVVNAASCASKAILVAPINDSFLVQIVGIVCPQLDGFMSGSVENRERGVIELHVPF